MASSTHHRRRKSLDEPPEIIAGVICLREEFIDLYERDYPQLQQCTERLRGAIKTFKKGYRVSTEGSKIAGVVGILGGAAVVAGLFALYTLGSYLLVAAVATLFVVVGAGNFIASGFQSVTCSSEKKQQITQLRQEVKAGIEEFQDKITPMSDKMKDIIDRTKKILKEQDVIRMEDIAELTVQMSEMICSTAVTTDFGRFSLVFDMISVCKNIREVNDINKLAETAITEIDESEMTSKVGKFIVEMRNLIHQLQNIIDKLEKTKDKIVIY
ncbi:hypothetical protein ABG768_001574 [Culter alburnus]|uniref:Uncharacterized protein n=1 Tax=Culter alburnus TaxID=194366 RepID=A0AAW2A3S3_CULAL